MRKALARAGIAVALAALASLTVVTPAQALGVGDGGAVKAEYGQDWSFSMSLSVCGYVQSYTVSEGSKQLISQQGYGYGTGFSFSSYELPPLAVGTHTLHVVAQSGYGCGTDSADVTVTVTKAPLTYDARIAADPNAPGNAIITVQAIGDFMDRLIPAAYRDENSARFPAGTWAIQVKDGDTVVHQVSIDGKFGDPGYVTSYWASAPVDTELTATATFTPSGSTAGDFTSEAPAPFGYTSAQLTNPGLTKPADDGPPSDAAPTGFTLPFWSLLAGGVVAAAAIALGVVAAVRLRRRSHRLDDLVAPLGEEAARARA